MTDASNITAILCVSQIACSNIQLLNEIEWGACSIRLMWCGENEGLSISTTAAPRITMIFISARNIDADAAGSRAGRAEVIFAAVFGNSGMRQPRKYEREAIFCLVII
ncbi:hypothetical protein CEXT_481311 [Caerostris extrusa]|uniref:Uncharacterized protein n=1 Tax=Caerostris extrusa TaxID=172846 RepID=A0AAV4R9E6_CAEEX|nr:hypothetical protein CEXT_481311 [Caerostris extrusa]